MLNRLWWQHGTEQLAYRCVHVAATPRPLHVLDSDSHLVELAIAGGDADLPAVAEALIDPGRCLVWQVQLHIVLEGLDRQLLSIQEDLHCTAAAVPAGYSVPCHILSPLADAVIKPLLLSAGCPQRPCIAGEQLYKVQAASKASHALPVLATTL